MQDQALLPSCFSLATTGDPAASSVAATKPGERVVASVYRAKIAGRCRLITITWCRNLMAHGLSVSVEGSDHSESFVDGDDSGCARVELRPWYFWRKHGSKRFRVGGIPVDLFWDFRCAKFASDVLEPQSSYYVVVVSSGETILLLGDRVKEAFKKTGSRPAVTEAALVSKKEHVFGKRRFSTLAKFHEKGSFHEITIECTGATGNPGSDPEMVIKINGQVGVRVERLHWKFRGNEAVAVDDEVSVEVYWDVHDWLFAPGLRHAVFIFKPTSSPLSSTSGSSLSNTEEIMSDHGASEFCLFLYAWKIE